MRKIVTLPLKRLAAILMCLVMAAALLLPVAAHAQKSGKTVRVGWYESAYHRTDQFGRRSGYGYEYQQRIATFTGWNYEYVDGSWSELLEMLIAGEIDLLSDVSYTEARAEKILYSAQGMGSEDYHAFIAADNTDISPDDFSTFNGKRVGVNKNSIQEQLFIEWSKSHGVHPEIVELSAKTPELLDMLARGEIDMLVTLDAYGKTADVLPVCKVGSADSYFGINKNRPDIKQELDVAMNRITEENRYFNQQLAEKYENSQAISGFLTADEKNWLTGHGTIRVGYRDNYLPFCGESGDLHALTGALADFLTFAQTAEKNAELSFETRAFDTTEAALLALRQGEIDCLFPVCLSAYDGEKLGVIVTDPLVSTRIYAAVRTADRQGISPEQETTVAVVKGSPNFETFLMDCFPDWKVEYYENSEAGYQAVASGEADCILVSNYRLNRVNNLCKKYNLSTLSTGEAMDLSFAVRREDDCLYSILNKLCRLIPNSSVNTSLTNCSFEEDRVTFGDFLRDNLPIVVTATAVTASVILLLLLWSIRAENKAMKERQLISAVELDDLTGLYDRSFFLEYTRRLYREHPEKPMDAVVLNIEQFHSVNELNGREFGDLVLRTLGEEMCAFLRETNGIGGRFISDHFELFCPPQDDYQAVLDRFQHRLNSLSRTATIRLRMGMMPWRAGMEPIQLFDRARTACGKVRGREKRLMIYDEEMEKEELLQQRLLNDLGRAVEEREFKVYYQPKYDIQSEPPKLNSAEALIRWQHPELGIVPPVQFIPLFERNGQIGTIDRYVWEETARQIADWRKRYGVTVPVSVNLSRLDVLDPSLEKTLDSLAAKYALDRSALNLEVTESAYTDNANELGGVIKRLREKGYEIEMDDFGSGYSSLSMLSSLPVDVLKMDMVFIRNIENSEKDVRLVEAILDIARKLKLPVVAEGVETESQMLLLKKLGCALVQGYYFSRPLPAEEFENSFLRKA